MGQEEAREEGGGAGEEAVYQAEAVFEALAALKPQIAAVLAAHESLEKRQALISELEEERQWLGKVSENVLAVERLKREVEGACGFEELLRACRAVQEWRAEWLAAAAGKEEDEWVGVIGERFESLSAHFLEAEEAALRKAMREEKLKEIREYIRAREEIVCQPTGDGETPLGDIRGGLCDSDGDQRTTNTDRLLLAEETAKPERFGQGEGAGSAEHKNGLFESRTQISDNQHKRMNVRNSCNATLICTILPVYARRVAQMFLQERQRALQEQLRVVREEPARLLSIFKTGERMRYEALFGLEKTQEFEAFFKELMQ